MQIDQSLRTAVAQAIRLAQSDIRWKPGKDVEHLQRRIKLAQLPATTTLAEYEMLIQRSLSDPAAAIYIYFHNGVAYPVVIAPWLDQRWAVILTLQGVMETAFMLWNPEDYIERRSLVYVGRLEEVVP